jgi:ribokinase
MQVSEQGAQVGAAPDVVVVGSLNVDLSIPVETLPGPGETVLGGDVLRGPGGKGANQAVAAARLGARVAFVGRVGHDESGQWLREQLEADEIDVRGLLATPGVPTGLAVIAVDADGENAIVVSSGANRRVTRNDVAKVAHLVASAPIVLTQLEIPLDVVNGLGAVARGRIICNPAPARPGLDLSQLDVVVPNRGELAVLAGAEPTPDLATVADQARSLDVPVVIVTLGGQGAMAVVNESGWHGPAGSGGGRGADVVVLPAMPVTAVDTTAAGDSFCGALAAALAGGAGVADAMGWAIRVAGCTVTIRGAQDSLPYLADVGAWHEDP